MEIYLKNRNWRSKIAYLIGHLDTLTNWVYPAQAKLVYESRASNWGNPSVFKNTNNKTSGSKNLKFNSKTTAFKSGTNE